MDMGHGGMYMHMKALCIDRWFKTNMPALLAGMFVLAREDRQMAIDCDCSVPSVRDVLEDDVLTPDEKDEIILGWFGTRTTVTHAGITGLLSGAVEGIFYEHTDQAHNIVAGLDCALYATSNVVPMRTGKHPEPVANQAEFTKKFGHLELRGRLHMKHKGKQMWSTYDPVGVVFGGAHTPRCVPQLPMLPVSCGYLPCLYRCAQIPPGNSTRERASTCPVSPRLEQCQWHS